MSTISSTEIDLSSDDVIVCQISPHCPNCIKSSNILYCLDKCIVCSTYRSCVKTEQQKFGRELYRQLNSPLKHVGFTLTVPSEYTLEQAQKTLLSKYKSLKSRFIKETSHILKLELQPNTDQLHMHIDVTLKPAPKPSDIERISSYKKVHIDYQNVSPKWTSYCKKKSTVKELKYFKDNKKWFTKNKLLLINIY